MKRLAAMLIVWAIASSCIAQTTGITDANRALADKQWSRAKDLYTNVLAADAGNGPAWYGLGMASLQVGDNMTAVAGFKRSAELKNNVPLSLYNLACAYARSGNVTDAMATLTKVAAVAPQLGLGAAGDIDFRDLQNQPGFRDLLIKANDAVKPCLKDPRNREFDFWVGSWDVYDHSSGLKVGTSRTDASLDGCLLIENWSGVFGDTGKSFNNIDPVSGRWHQYWVANNGTVSRYEGTFTKGSMRFEGEFASRGGTTSQVRLTFEPQPDGSVRQTSEGKTSTGEWITNYDFLYRKKQ